MYAIFANLLKYVTGALVTALAGFLIMGRKSSFEEIGLMGLAGFVLYLAFDLNCAAKNGFASSSDKAAVAAKK